MAIFTRGDFKRFLAESQDQWTIGPVCLPNHIYLTRGDQVIAIDGNVASLGQQGEVRTWRREFKDWLEAAYHLHEAGFYEIDLVLKQAFINQARAQGLDP